MNNRDQNRRTNDSLQSGEKDPAFGQEAAAFGAGGQKIQRPLAGNDAPDRNTDRDNSVPENAGPSTRQQEQNA